MKDPGKSIRARLLNIAKKENLSFQLVIIRYMHERLLYRISLSDYSNSFCLKGGALMYIYTLEKTRPTRDIDFLGSDIPYDKSFVETVFRMICSISYPPDAIFFDSGSSSCWRNCVLTYRYLGEFEIKYQFNINSDTWKI